jgi:hypothetical protein
MNLNKQLVEKDLLLRDISDVDIYKCYAPELSIELGKRQISPLREEKNGSFALFASNNEILFKDFVLGGGDCIRFVQLKYGYNFNEALSRIVIDFGLTDKYAYTDLSAKPTPHKVGSVNRDEVMKQANKSLIQIKVRKWLLKDMHFWTPFGIGLNTLKKYNVVPLSHLFVNNNIITCGANTYAFVEFKDGVETYKIYQPEVPEHKWINNHDESVWQGWSQLPEKGDKVIITKSLKDIMTIDSLTGIPAVSLQAESVSPKDHIIKELKERFNQVWVWYDNDFDGEENWGRNFGKKLAEEFDLIQTEIPDEYRIKDPSDFCAKKGKEETIKLIHKLTEVPF